MTGSRPEHGHDVRAWLRIARLDYITVYQLDRSTLSEIVCFHCQQCVEKHLKALLSAHEVVPPRTHDLVVLGQLAADWVPDLDALQHELEMLTQFAVDMRYPDAWADDLLATQAIDAMERVRQVLRAALGLEEPADEPDGDEQADDMIGGDGAAETR